MFKELGTQHRHWGEKNQRTKNQEFNTHWGEENQCSKDNQALRTHTRKRKTRAQKEPGTQHKHQGEENQCSRNQEHSTHTVKRETSCSKNQNPTHNGVCRIFWGGGGGPGLSRIKTWPLETNFHIFY